MQSLYSAHIVPREWRWVVLISSGLILLSLLPLIWLVLSVGDNANMQFMGALNDHINSATYLSRIAQGAEGEWLLHFQHTPEPHSGTFIHLIYMLLGQLSRLLSMSPIVMFHVARVGASMFMYAAIYQMGATIWMRVRSRRIFFMFAAIGAGFGWVFSILTGNPHYPDLTLPQAFPLSSTYANVHFPLTTACLALLVSIVVMAFRPGMNEKPGVMNGGLLAAVLSLLLALLYAESLLPLGLALLFYMVVYTRTERRISLRALRWLMVIVLPAVPVGTYYLIVGTSNPAVAEWSSQNIDPMPSPLALLIALGLPLLIALPGILRALRRFEPDGDQFMLVWLVVILVFSYLPTPIQARFALGVMLPVAYFATRSTEDFWFQYMRGRWRYRLLAALVPIMIASQLVVLFAPLLAVNSGRAPGVLLNRDYTTAFEWLRRRTSLNDVVLAAPNVSVWLPVWARARVVYGHPAETLNAQFKRRIVERWYQDANVDCSLLLDGQYSEMGTYRVKYVLIGPVERALGETPCISVLQEVARFGSVSIYIPIVGR